MKRKVRESLTDMADKVDRDHEVELARSELYQIADHAIKLHDLLKGVSEMDGLDAETQADITKAASHIEAVYHKLDYESKPEDFDISSELGFDEEPSEEDTLGGGDITLDEPVGDLPISTRPFESVKRNDIKELLEFEKKLNGIVDTVLESTDPLSVLNTATNVRTARKLNSSQVKAVQSALKQLGHNIMTDGIYGRNTANAVRAFQKSKGLRVDGDAGSVTIKALIGSISKRNGGKPYPSIEQPTGRDSNTGGIDPRRKERMKAGDKPTKPVVDQIPTSI